MTQYQYALECGIDGMMAESGNPDAIRELKSKLYRTADDKVAREATAQEIMQWHQEQKARSGRLVKQETSNKV